MKIKMVAFPVPVSKLYYNWTKGIEKHGDILQQLSNTDSLKGLDADCYYQTNELKRKFFKGNREETQGKYFRFILDSQKPYIVSESNPFRQFNGWTRFGWNSYKWTAGNFNNENAPRDRWNRFEKITGIKFKDWNSPGDNILIMGQKEGDSALNSMYEQGFKNSYEWMWKVIKKIRKHSDRPIVIRPHPRGMEKKGLPKFKEFLEENKIANVKFSVSVTPGGNQGGAGLEYDLDNSYCVVTFNSNSAIEAVIKGIPVFSLDDGCMAYPISHTDLSQIENLKYDINLDDWQNKIAYTIWNKEDVQTGRTWEHLKPVYFKD